MTNKIHFKLIETEETIKNGTRELTDKFQVPKWVAKRAASLIGEEETWILDANAEENTFTFSYACGDDVEDWNDLAGSAWGMCLNALRINRPIELS